MTKLILGVVNIPYGDTPSKRKKNKKAGVTTLSVAEILEEKYHIMQHFWDKRGDKIADDLAKSYLNALKSRMMGAPTTLDPAGSALSQTSTMFDKFISNREIEKMGIAGVPTKAAKRGVNHRLAHPFAKDNPRRPSFDDTGLYKSSFRAWLEEK